MNIGQTELLPFFELSEGLVQGTPNLNTPLVQSELKMMIYSFAVTALPLQCENLEMNTFIATAPQPGGDGGDESGHEPKHLENKIQNLFV